MIIRTATVDDVEQMMELDYRFYPEEWHVRIEDVKRTFQAGHHLARVLDTPQGIKGYYAHIPLPKKAYEYVLKGELSEGSLSEYVMDYRTEPKEVYLYSVSMIVDIADECKKEYTKALIRDMPSFLRYIPEKGIEIKELGAIVISEAGKRIAERMGYSHTGQLLTYENKEYPVYRAQLKDILHSIKL